MIDLKKGTGFILCILLTVINLHGQSNSRPGLVVCVVVDQMKPDYLTSYKARYGEGGFKRMLKDGVWFKNCYLNYVPSYTGPGHASIATGTVPAVHGITANDFYFKGDTLSTYCVEDPQAGHIGGTISAGNKSPKNLLTTTLSDELKSAQNFEAKTFAVSIKDRGAILPGGHAADAAYWLDDRLGVFMSSGYYLNQLPDWVNHFNEHTLNHSAYHETWTTLYPLNTYLNYQQDNNRYEGKFPADSNSSFPHHLGTISSNNLRYTPYGNTMLESFAEELILREQLGTHSTTDFISISFSSTDYVGHVYGPGSVEVEDTYLRLDRVMSDLLDFLDKRLGRENYLLCLTADHGVTPNAFFSRDKKIPGDLFFDTTLLADLKTGLQKKNIPGDVIRQIRNDQVFLNEERIQKLGFTREAVVQIVTRILLRNKQVQYAVDMEKLDEANLPDAVKRKLQNGYLWQRSGDVAFIPVSGTYSAYGITGATHGGWNTYDARIPLLFFGWNTPHGIVRHDNVYVTDIAPTIASMLGIPPPSGSIGEVLFPFE